ncbi:hypothetical protein ROZALSC1DRAFT_29124 [Rozella allomycis CSF55]|uniref:Uncharacterized protein n=1 Tax=Rozella allomycis (strain CSF55) TaxID=988480 RepID=A0A075AWR3_ROZAC|nr:hypothetical protein O9G_003123 [Rozella allomycis CSF55]RKP19260.1 hypothetical protein ROZALSC1DRAFT_29124 [Rozella allomycis CSF55]|eukprot:EPZ33127.1 hypothetical protein O9G_003123 [Rozella allomycis CSF55]
MLTNAKEDESTSIPVLNTDSVRLMDELQRMLNNVKNDTESAEPVLESLESRVALVSGKIDQLMAALEKEGDGFIQNK